MTTVVARIENDLLGEREVPRSAYYGIHTLRARENFRVSGTTIGRQQPDLIAAVADVKKAAALANQELGVLDSVRAEAISRACDEVARGAWFEQFVVDPFQGGAGTSVNMNANEVIANRAIELLGGVRGAYSVVHPLNHVNLSQSTNDVYPTALRVALHRKSTGMRDWMIVLAKSLERKASALEGVAKLGRTQLQDAVPMTFGDEFRVFATAVRNDLDRLSESLSRLIEVNLGGTAIGTGVNAPKAYPAVVCRTLARVSGVPVRVADDAVAATSDTAGFVDLSGVLRRIAVNLSKMSNDLRLLSSGPVGGLGEIRLPALQAGSSIMPGKVNPVIPELVNQIAFDVIGGDVTITMAAEAGQLQLNAFGPLMAHRLLQSMSLLEAGCRALAQRCIPGITVDPHRTAHLLEASTGLLTVLGSRLGYDVASALAQEISETGISLREAIFSKGLLTGPEFDGLVAAAVQR